MVSFAAFLALSSPSPLPWVERGIAAMGGRQALETIAKGRFRTVGHSYMVEQSERPDGPFFTMYEDREEEIDYAKGSITGSVKLQGIAAPTGFARKFTVETRTEPRSTSPDVYTAVERLAMGPERVLLVAAGAKDLAAGRDLVFQGVPHHTVRFHWGAVPVTVLLNADTGLPTAVETTMPRPGFFRTWGDVTFQTLFGNWDLQAGKRLFPTLWTVKWNGTIIRDSSLVKAEFETGDANREVPAPQLPAPFAPLEKFPGRLTEVVPGVSQIQSNFNMAAVEQPDGLVILEATTSPVFFDAALKQFEAKYPGKRIKAVASTTDAWPHFGGLRSAVARGIPVYALRRNRPILERFLRAPHEMEPDALSSHPTRPRFHWVDGPTEIGEGPTAVRLFPLLGEGSERMMAAYLPGAKLLYGSDLVQPQSGGFFSLGYLAELRNAVERERLEVQTVFAMHSVARPWSEVTTALDKL